MHAFHSTQICLKNRDKMVMAAISLIRDLLAQSQPKSKQ